MKIYSLYDTVAEKFGNPFVSENHNVAIRDFAAACNQPKSPMAMFPNDIELVFLGDFDERTGLIKGNDKPITLTKAKEFVMPETTENEVKKRLKQNENIVAITENGKLKAIKSKQDTK